MSDDGDMNAQVAVYLARLQQVAEVEFLFQNCKSSPVFHPRKAHSIRGELAVSRERRVRAAFTLSAFSQYKRRP